MKVGTLLAYGTPWPPSTIGARGNKNVSEAAAWRGVVDEVTRVEPYRSSRRLWRCEHRHRTDLAAERCANAAVDRGLVSGGSR